MNPINERNESEQTTQNSRRRSLLWAGLGCASAALVLGLTGCYTGSGAASTASAGPAQAAGEQEDDRNTTSLVNAALAADPEYKFNTVTVATSAGTVQLSGFVSSAEQKTRAGDITKNITTVKEVVNNITVQPPAS